MKGKRIADIKLYPQFKDMEENQLRETFGTGFISNWVNRLSLGIASIHAGNTSIKLKKKKFNEPPTDCWKQKSSPRSKERKFHL